jgi:hypothetical protein
LLELVPELKPLDPEPLELELPETVPELLAVVPPEPPLDAAPAALQWPFTSQVRLPQ